MLSMKMRDRFDRPTHDSTKATFERLRHPGSGWCIRCGRPWAVVKGHVTHYTESRGCFPLCDECWVLLGNAEARIEYYLMMINEWERQGCEVTPGERRAIGQAVANGE